MFRLSVLGGKRGTLVSSEIKLSQILSVYCLWIVRFYTLDETDLNWSWSGRAGYVELLIWWRSPTKRLPGTPARTSDPCSRQVREDTAVNTSHHPTITTGSLSQLAIHSLPRLRHLCATEYLLGQSWHFLLLPSYSDNGSCIAWSITDNGSVILDSSYLELDYQSLQ